MAQAGAQAQRPCRRNSALTTLTFAEPMVLHAINLGEFQAANSIRSPGGAMDTFLSLGAWCALPSVRVSAYDIESSYFQIAGGGAASKVSNYDAAQLPTTLSGIFCFTVNGLFGYDGVQFCYSYRTCMEAYTIVPSQTGAASFNVSGGAFVTSAVTASRMFFGLAGTSTVHNGQWQDYSNLVC